MIYSTFTTIQGTGALAGVVQHFIRFAGCAVRCPIRSVCDEQDALKFGSGMERDPAELAAEAFTAVGRNGWVHITGGEPCDSPELLCDVARECTRLGMRIHLQTSGLRRVPIEWDWLTVSPKCPALELQQARGNECVVVYDPAVIVDMGVLRAYYEFTKFLHYYLVPLCQPDGTTNAVEAAGMVQRCNRAGMSWRLAIQAHKHWGIA